MRRKRILSMLLTLVMLLTCLSPIASADIFINGSGSSGSGIGNVNTTTWSPQADNTTGYRVSVYYAPVDKNSDTYNPTYDWTRARQIGRTIDIKASESYNQGSLIYPNYWGNQSVWEYLKEGGASNANFYPMSAADFDDYHYYYFSDGESSIVQDEYGAHICAIFNDDVLTQYGITQDILQADSDEVWHALEEAEATLPADNENGKSAIATAKKYIVDAQNLFNQGGTDHWTLPLVFGAAVKANGGGTQRMNGNRNDIEGLNAYLMHPTILKLLGKATGGNFSAIDVYMGRVPKLYEDGKDVSYNLGTYKIIVENLMLFGATPQGEGYRRISGTFQDIIASGIIGSQSYGYSILTYIGKPYEDNMIQTLRLSTGDRVLSFKNMGGMYMGQLIDEGRADYSIYNTNERSMWSNFAPDRTIGNISGLEVITSTAIGSYGITEQPKQSVLNLVSLSVAGERDSRLSNLQLYTDVDSLVNIRSAVTYDKFADFVENGEAGYKAFAEAASGTTDPNNLQYVKALKINPHFQPL